MFYNYIFYRLYNWVKAGIVENTFYPHLGAIYLFTLLLLSNAYFILTLLDRVHILKYEGDFIYSPSTKILIAVFVSMFLFNHLYFFWINKWREVVDYFKNNIVSSKIKILSNTYIAFSVLSFIIIYFFNL
jgi:hypothetical protein